MSVVHRSQGVLRAGQPAAAQRAGDRRRAGCGAARRRSLPWDELVGDYDRIRDLIARVVPGFDDFNERVARRPTASAAQRRPRARLRVDRRPRALHRRDAARSDAAAGPAAHDDDPQPRPVQHHDLRPRRSLPRHQAASAACVLMNPADIAERGLVERQVVDLIGEWQRRGARRRPASSWCPTTCRAGNCADLLPRGQPAGAARQRRRPVATRRRRSRW